MAQHMSGPASLSGQVALITGGAGGMGRAIRASSTCGMTGPRVPIPTA